MDTGYDPSGNSNSSFHVGADILNSLIVNYFFKFLHAWYMLGFDKATYLSPLYRFTLSITLSKTLRGSDVPLFLGFTNIVSIIFYSFVEFIIMWYTFLVISFIQYKEYIIFLISFIKISGVLPAFTCASSIGNLWRIC